jgi:hypothetical protein
MARLHPTEASTGVLPATGPSLAQSRRHAVVVRGIFLSTTRCSGAKADSEARPPGRRRKGQE